MVIRLIADLNDKAAGTIFLVAAGLMLVAVMILAVSIFLQMRRGQDSRLTQRQLREDMARLAGELPRQLDQLQNGLSARVAESNRDQREINALFLGQLQQYGQGSGQMLENVRRTVTESLNKVSGSLQEMQSVTAEVRSLKQVLGNVRTRGIIGELQLDRLLSDVLSPGQFLRQVRIRPEKQEAVEFAICIPATAETEERVLLPVDAKFPLDCFARLLAALDAGDLESAEVFRRELSTRIRQEAKKIAELYLLPPRTTDFAILYLPTESLFLEVSRDTDLIAEIYRNYQIIVTGPSSMTALLAGLQATFRLQTLEQKSVLIARQLAEVQRDFHLFETSLDRVRNRLARSLNEIEDSSRKAGQVRRRLDSLELDDWNGDDADETAGEEDDHD